MTGNTHMPNLRFTYFTETKCDDNAGPICDSSLSDTKLLNFKLTSI